MMEAQVEVSALLGSKEPLDHPYGRRHVQKMNCHLKLSNLKLITRPKR